MFFSKEKKSYYLYLISIAFVLLLTECSHVCYGSIYNLPSPRACLPSLKQTGWRKNDTHEICALRENKNYLPNETTIVSGGMTNYMLSYPGFFLPYSATWRVNMYMCSGATKKVACTIAKASSIISSDKAVYMGSKVAIGNQDGDMGGATGIIPAGTSICYSIEDVKSPGVEWGIRSDEHICGDVHELPANPSDCYINYGEKINVDLGVLERSEIPVVPDSSNKYAKNKDVSVLCVRDGTSALTTEFKYTSVDVNGNDFVSTGIPGIGIAIYYNGQLVKNGEELPVEDFSTGENKRTLYFVPVRDKNIALKDVGTGDFSANAVMVMTEQ